MQPITHIFAKLFKRHAVEIKINEQLEPDKKKYVKFIKDRDFVKTVISNTNYFTVSNVNNRNIDECKISIVMCSSNRSKQTYFTLKTISESSVKNIHIILVDDSDVDKILLSELKKLDLNIDFIEINKRTKCWVNPCVNYNIGFQYVKCSKVIIQNAEVCHVGDVCKYVDLNTDDTYKVFDVVSTDNYDENNILHNADDLSFDALYRTFKENNWYQHATHVTDYHFLTSLSRETFDKLNGFSFDYFSEGCYDDNDFLLKIRSLNIPIIDIHCEDNKFMGIHQYHVISTNSWAYRMNLNPKFFDKKHAYYLKFNAYVDIDELPNQEVIKLF